MRRGLLLVMVLTARLARAQDGWWQDAQREDARAAQLLDLIGEEDADIGLAFDEPFELAGLWHSDEPSRREVAELRHSDAGGGSHSIGRPQDGALAAGRQLPEHPGYRILRPDRAWATDTTIGWMTRAFDVITARDPLAPQVMVHDLSLRDGGPMHGHGSHQSGRDVDLMYYQHGCNGVCRARSLRAEQLDAARQWGLLSQWLQRGQAEFIFIDYGLQAPLYEAALNAGASAAELQAWFQYPRGRGHLGGVIRHWRNHRNHLHVRFVCPPDDGGCTRSGPSRGRRAEPRVLTQRGIGSGPWEQQAETVSVLELLAP